MHDALGELLANRRLKAVIPHVRGRLLDLGCGSNRLVRHYSNGVGVDVHPWPGVDIVVSDTAALHWDSHSFDTITIVAALNHIPNRRCVLDECRRVLRPTGRVVVTMLTPRISRFWHRLRGSSDADQRERGMQPGEVYGFVSTDLIELFECAGFSLVLHRRFMLGLNGLYVFRVSDAQAIAAPRVKGGELARVG
jgi:SAM-dependent methyltransferase